MAIKTACYSRVNHFNVLIIIILTLGVNGRCYVDVCAVAAKTAKGTNFGRFGLLSYVGAEVQL